MFDEHHGTINEYLAKSKNTIQRSVKCTENRSILRNNQWTPWEIADTKGISMNTMEKSMKTMEKWMKTMGKPVSIAHERFLPQNSGRRDTFWLQKVANSIDGWCPWESCEQQIWGTRSMPYHNTFPIPFVASSKTESLGSLRLFWASCKRAWPNMAKG